MTAQTPTTQPRRAKGTPVRHVRVGDLWDEAAGYAAHDLDEDGRPVALAEVIRAALASYVEHAARGARPPWFPPSTSPTRTDTRGA